MTTITAHELMLLADDIVSGEATSAAASAEARDLIRTGALSGRPRAS